MREAAGWICVLRVLAFVWIDKKAKKKNLVTNETKKENLFGICARIRDVFA